MIIIRITKRDREFLFDLYNVKYLNSNRICRLFTEYRSCMNRMKIMVKNNLIRILERNNNGEYIFCIAKKGCKIIDKEYIGIKKTDKLSHALACTDFYFRFKEEIESVKFEEQYYFSYKGKKMSFRPDVIAKINRWIFIEIDLSGRRFESKVKTWEGFYQSRAYNKYFDKFPPIIIITKHLDRVKPVIERCKTVDLNYVFKDYKDIQNWEYKYSKGDNKL